LAILGGTKDAPAVTLKMMAAFVVPCGEGQSFSASGTLTLHNVGGFLDGFATASGVFVCGVSDKGGKLAEIDAQVKMPITIAKLITIESVTVSVKVTKVGRQCELNPGSPPVGFELSALGTKM